MRNATYGFLFGAGASHGAGAVVPSCPPLGNQLYEALIEAYPQTWGALVQPDEDQAFRDTDLPFEKGMGLVWERREARAQLLITDLALYFTRFEPRGNHDCYSRLLALLQLRGVLGRSTFGSLNYDCLFELAAGNVGLGVNYSGRPGPPGTLSLVKPHGSCNFVMQGLGRNLVMKNVTVAGSQHFFEGPVEPRHPREIAALYAAGPSMPPAISLYAPGKPSPMAHTFLDGVREYWGETVHAADIVVVIGARVVLDDRHVWDPIREAQGRVWYVGSPVGPDFAAFAADLGERLTLFAETFAAAIERLDGRLQILA